jgi:hypothetical protein
LPTLTKILRYFLDRAEAEAAKAGGGDGKVVYEMLREARTTAAQLAPFQAPTAQVGRVVPRRRELEGGVLTQ